MRFFSSKNLGLYLSLSLAVTLNVALWFYSNKTYTKWTNVPPAPKFVSANISFLGDPAMAYRASGLALQNFGNVGKAHGLKDYNYKYVEEWFWLMDRLDSHSDFMPYLAAYYFGATPDEAQVPLVIRYLEEVGVRDGKWRWLAQAAYLARHVMHNKEEALRLSRKLSSVYKPPMPIWTKNMEPMLMADMGDKQAAYIMMLEILKSNKDQMSASEYTSTIRLICDSVLPPEQAKTNPVCQK